MNMFRLHRNDAHGWVWEHKPRDQLTVKRTVTILTLVDNGDLSNTHTSTYYTRLCQRRHQKGRRFAKNSYLQAVVCDTRITRIAGD